MADLEMTDFSEDAAVEFVLQHLPEEFKDGMNRSTCLLYTSPSPRDS